MARRLTSRGAGRSFYDPAARSSDLALSWPSWPEGDMDWRQLESFSYGDNPALADELVALVVAGRKTATCWAAAEGLLTTPGKRMVARDGQGRPRAVIEATELTQRRFGEVDEAFAFDEGEGDRTLSYWRTAHKRYFTRLGQFSPDMLLWCERFRVVEVIAPPLPEAGA